MSKLGKKPIPIKDTKIRITDDNLVLIKGAKGEFNFELPHNISAEIDEAEQILILTRRGETARRKRMHGTYRSLIANAIIGVTEGFSKTLVFKGVGYKAETQGEKLILNLGYSHQIEYPIPQGIEIKVDVEKIVISGIDKQLVGEVAAKIRELKISDAYKGHGLRYIEEQLKLKPGKAAAKGTEGK
ncbi:MAG: 50S ribosomal protein L6 [Patescibacteria group bacterium]|nr:50S ribosomal protein L6 [Patescibacteria group bacterium]